MERFKRVPIFTNERDVVLEAELIEESQIVERERENFKCKLILNQNELIESYDEIDDVYPKSKKARKQNDFSRLLSDLQLKMIEINTVVEILNTTEFKKNGYSNLMNNLRNKFDEVIGYLDNANSTTSQAQASVTNEDNQIESDIFDESQVHERPHDQYIFDGVDLLQVEANNPHRYALRVASIIFTREELQKTIIFEHKDKNIAAKRAPIDPIRLQILKNAIKCKYNYSSLEFEKEWPKMRKAINLKGIRSKYDNAIRIKRTLTNQKKKILES